MPLFWLSMATFVAGITGALAQLWMGYIGDRVQSRFGRRRPFIAVLSIVGGVAIICLMFPPDVIVASQSSVIIWFFAFFTIVEVRYCAWFFSKCDGVRPESRDTTSDLSFFLGFFRITMTRLHNSRVWSAVPSFQLTTTAQF